MKVKEFLKNLWNDESGQWGGYAPNKIMSWIKPIGGYVTNWQESVQKRLKEPKILPRTYGGSVSPQYTQPAPTYTYKGGGGSVSPTYQYPKTEKVVIPPQVTQPQVTQPPAIQQAGGGGYQPFDFSKYMAQYQPTGWTPPELPQEPQVTQEMIANWQKRSREEAGMQFEPQILEIQQQLEKMLLGTEQAKGGIEQPYQDIVDYVEKWQKEETGAAQRRYYARGLGRGGGLPEREGEIAEQALTEVTKAGTEKARKLADIESQKLLMMEQAGAKKEEIEVQRGRYIAARSTDLEESHRQNRTQLEQQRFANQMQIAQVGMTKEAEDFNRWLGTMSAANEIWYRDQTLTLERESMSLSASARAEADLWKREQATEDKRRWEAEMDWEKEQAGTTGALSAEDLRNLYGEAFINRYSGYTPNTQEQYLSGMGVPSDTISEWLKKLYSFSGITSSSAGAMGGGY